MGPSMDRQVNVPPRGYALIGRIGPMSARRRLFSSRKWTSRQIRRWPSLDCQKAQEFTRHHPTASVIKMTSIRGIFRRQHKDFSAPAYQV
jgi:hypothetical protein